MKKHVITIAGRLGSGKSTVSKLIAKKLGYAHNYAGGLMRQLAEERGLTFEEYHKLMESDPNFDRLVDERQKEFIESQDNIVAEGHVAFFLAPDSFKVFLDLDPHVAAERIFNDLQKNPLRKVERNMETVDEVEKSLEKRLGSNMSRWKEMYGFDYLDKNNFDCVINTEKRSPEEVADLIVEAYEKWLKS